MKMKFLTFCLLMALPFAGRADAIQFPSCPLPGNGSILIDNVAIAERIAELSQEINRDYAGREIQVVGVLKGSICVVADLIRQLDIPLQVHFITASSYGMRGTVSGELTLSGFASLDLEGKEILIVDDIYDTGKTMTGIMEKMKEQGAGSIKSLVLLQKNVPHVSSISPDYVGFHIGEEFVIGYGLDYEEQYRGLKDIYVVEE